jgi:hypothetical protein
MKITAVIASLMLMTLSSPAQKYVPTNNTLNGKVMFGYQGWHATPNDGSGNNVWRHYFGGGSPDAKNADFDVWPDMREYPDDVTEATNMHYSDGKPAKLYSAYKYGAVDLHFKWMMEHELDGVFEQRFISDIRSRGGRRHFNQVVRNVQTASEKYQRVYCIMYDISGAGPNWKRDLINDWKFLVDSLHVTEGKSYLHHNGKPLLSIWGLGFDHTKPFAPVEQVDSILDWFHKNAPKKYQATIMGGINDTWITHGDDWKAVYNKIDIISPWSVGRYHDWLTAYKFKQNKIIPDKAYCDAYNIAYMPVIFPGFSWYNLRHGKSPFNQIPRNYGGFYWNQSYNVIDAGVKMIYIAMFDEIDEGTAMYKVAPTAAERPAGEKFLSLDQDGIELSSDWYLQLAQATSNILRGKTKNTAKAPMPKDFVINYQRYMMGLNVNIPKDFTGTDKPDTERYTPRPDIDLMSSSAYKLTSKDNHVVIKLTFFSTDTAKMKGRMIGKWFYIEANHQHIINNLMDTSNVNTRSYNRKEYDLIDSNKVNVFKADELKKYNADDAGIANIPVTRPYKGIYHKLKVLYMYKKGRGEVYSFYYYNDDISLQKYLDETRYMLTYRD